MGWEMPYTIEVPLLPRDAGVPTYPKPRDDPEADRSHPNRDGAIQKRIDPIMRRDDMKVDHWGQG